MEDTGELSQLERIFRHAQSVYGTTPEYLWESSPDSAVLRHGVSKKWYAAALKVQKSKLGLSGDEYVYVLNVKCDSLMLGSLLLEKGFFPAYHMNKNSWISILLDETVSDGEIFSLLELSYGSVAPKMKKRK